jgi:hypothetical protein
LPARFTDPPRFGSRRFLRFEDFLSANAAAALHEELAEGLDTPGTPRTYDDVQTHPVAPAPILMPVHHLPDLTRFRGQMRLDIDVYDRINAEFIRSIWSCRRTPGRACWSSSTIAPAAR